MGTFNNIKKFLYGFGQSKENAITINKIVDLLNQGTSLLNISKDLYNIPEIRTAINFVAEKLASIQLQHVRIDLDGNLDVINDKVNYVLNVRSNQYQCPQVFWTYVYTRLLIANNVFIAPEWDESGQLQALYPLPFTSFEFTRDENGKLIIFFNSTEYSFYYEDIIHLQRFPVIKGGSKTQATGNYIEIVNTLQSQAVKDSVNANRIMALIKTVIPLKGTDAQKKLNEFKELYLTSENTTGFGFIDNNYDVQELKLNTNTLNTELLNSIIKLIYNYFGVSDKLLNHSASELEYEQFVDNTIKPVIWQTEEETTYKIFSKTEIYHFNRIQAEIIDLEISTLSAKTIFYKEMIFGGVLTRNEVRKRLGIKKAKGLDEFLESKNFQALKPGNYVVEGGEGENG